MGYWKPYLQIQNPIGNWFQKFRLEWAILLVLIGTTFLFGLIWFLPRDLIFNSQWILDIRSIPSFDWFKGLSFLILFLWGSVYVLLSLTLISLLLHVNRDKSICYRFLLFWAVPVLVFCFVSGFWVGIAGLIHFIFLFTIIRFELFQNVFRLGLDTFLRSEERRVGKEC